MSALKYSMVSRILRIFLWFVVLAAIGIGILLLVSYLVEENRIAKLKKEAQELHTKVTRAQRNATPREWVVRGEQDPASREKIARSVSIQSDCGLCFLTVEKRMNGSDLTDLSCQDPIEIDWTEPIEVKFDTHDNSQKMKIRFYSNLRFDWNDEHGNDMYHHVYITTDYYHDYWGFFINGLLTASTVAIKITPTNDYAESFWVRFTLKGSKAAIGQLGKQMPK